MRVLDRVRMPVAAAGVVLLAASAVLDGPGWLGWSAAAVFVAGVALYTRVGTPAGRPVDIGVPVGECAAGEGWVAANSPTSRVPSHGIHAWAQTYALDLVYRPADRPAPGRWPLVRRPADFPGFGAPVRAPLEGRVVRAVGLMRDHRDRRTPAGLVLFAAESMRELLGPVGVLGNHLVIRGGDGSCVVLAHLQRRSLQVRRGDPVGRGDVVARCGNSGNSTEPHLHLQVMDRPSVWIAAACPVLIEGRDPPASGQPLGLSPAPRPRE